MKTRTLILIPAAALIAASGVPANAAVLQCTTYVAGRLVQDHPNQDFSGLIGKTGTVYGSAASWYGTAKNIKGVSVSSTPGVGYIMVFAGGGTTAGDGRRYPIGVKFAAAPDGHVALVRSVSDSQNIRIDQSHWTTDNNGGISTNVPVRSGDSWVTARVYNGDSAPGGIPASNSAINANYFGSQYAVTGFINVGSFPSKKK